MTVKQMELMINEPKAVHGVSCKENQYIYRKRWGQTKKATFKGNGEYVKEPSLASLKLKERLHRGRNKKVKNSIHRHPLISYKILKEDKIICTICEIYIIGLAYGCDQDCDDYFIIHKSCLNTPTTPTNHWSHQDHTLTLRPLPVDDDDKAYLLLCAACCDGGEGYHYHCTTCKVDLHVACTSIPQRVHCYLHRYPLTLFIDQPIPDKKTVKCNICQDVIILKGWIYYNEGSEFVAHLGCALTMEIEESFPNKLVDGGVEDQKEEEKEAVDNKEEEEVGKEVDGEEEEEKSSPNVAITGSNRKKNPKPGCKLVDDGVKEKEGEEDDVNKDEQEENEEVKEKEVGDVKICKICGTQCCYVNVELGCGGEKCLILEAITGSDPKKTPKPGCKLEDDQYLDEDKDEENEKEVKEEVGDFKICKICGSRCYYLM